MSLPVFRFHFFAALVSAALAVLPGAALAAQAPLSGGPVLDKTTFDGSATQERTILHIARTGRYTIAAEGKLGSEIRLVDRMAGEIGRSGTIGGIDAINGRIDRFLEPGDYQVRLAKRAGDRVTLGVQAFANAASPADPDKYPWMTARLALNGELKDRQLMGWWIRIDAGHPDCVVELIGRSLAGAVLWKDGLWETGIEPLAGVFEPAPGKPMTRLEFNLRPVPGDYLLLAYGGPARAWGSESAAQPFHLRAGATYRGEMGRLPLTIGASGQESFLISGNASLVEMEVRDNQRYSLGVADYRNNQNRLSFRNSGSLNEKSTTRRISLSAGGDRRTWVVVQGPPGAQVNLRWLPALNSYYGGPARANFFDKTGAYLATVLSSLGAADYGDVSAALLDEYYQGRIRQLDLGAARLVELTEAQGWRQRVNNDGTSSFLLRVRSPGAWGVVEANPAVNSRYSFQPLNDWVLGGGAKPVTITAGQSLDLAERVYVLTIQGNKLGINDFALVKKGLLGLPAARDALAGLAPPVLEGFSLALNVGRNPPSSTLLTGLPGDRGQVGVSARRLPLDLGEPFCLNLPAGARVQLSLSQPAASLLTGIPSSVSATLDSEPWRAGQAVPAGAHTLVLQGGAVEEWLVLAAELPDPAVSLPAPHIPDPAALYPGFTEGRPVWRDFAREESAWYLLDVPAAGTYRISTTGRLNMEIEVRSFLNPRLFSARANSDGGNASVFNYLNPGRYLVRIAALDQSAGRAGLLLTRPGLLEAGILRPGSISRRSVPADTVLSAGLDVPVPGDYRLEALTLGESYSWRIEDTDGWPIGQVLGQGSAGRYLDSGSYRYLSYPGLLDARRILRFDRDGRQYGDPADAESGDGLRLNVAYEGLWRETPERTETRYRLDVPGAMSVSLSLSEGMDYRLVPPAGEVLSGRGGRTVPLRLEAGRYTLLLRGTEVDDRKPYSFRFDSLALAPGMPVSAAPGSNVELSVGEAGYYEIASWGPTEVAAELYGLDDKRLVAAGQTILDDWNFRLVCQLAPGSYLLHLRDPDDPVPEAGDRVLSSTVRSREGGPVRLSVTRRPGVADPALSDSPQVRRGLGSEIVSQPFTPGSSAVYRLEAQAAVPPELALFKGDSLLAAGRGHLFLPLKAGERYMLRYWQNGTGLLDVATSAVALSPGAMQKVAPANGLSVWADLEDAAGYLYSPGLEQAFVAVAPGLALNTTGGGGWLIRADGGNLAPVALDPVRLVPGQALSLSLDRWGQGFSLEVPAGSVALVQAAGAATAPGLSLAGGENRVWSKTWLRDSRALLGARAGSHRGQLWSSAANPADCPRGSVLASLYPVTEQRPMASGGQEHLVLAPGSALVLELDKSIAGMKVSAEKGVVVFGWDGQPNGLVQDPSAAWTALLDLKGAADKAGSVNQVVVVNTGSQTALADLAASRASTQSVLSTSQDYERLLGGTEKLQFKVTAGARDTIFVYGPATQIRFVSDDSGLVSDARPTDTDIGTIQFLPGGNGRLELNAGGGLLRIWVGQGSDSRAGFLGKDLKPRESALGALGGVLQSSPQSWPVTVDKDAILLFHADGPGVMGLVNSQGTVLNLAAGFDGQGFLARLAKGSYRLVTRPFRDGERSGMLTVNRMEAEDVSADGALADRLIGPGEKHLYRLRVAAEGRVGAGVAVEDDNLAATLFDQGFNALGTGAIFIRELPPGEYFLLVEGAGGTQRYHGVFWGLGGSRAAVPADVQQTYQPE